MVIKGTGFFISLFLFYYIFYYRINLKYEDG